MASCPVYPLWIRFITAGLKATDPASLFSTRIQSTTADPWLRSGLVHDPINSNTCPSLRSITRLILSSETSSEVSSASKLLSNNRDSCDQPSSPSCSRSFHASFLERRLIRQFWSTSCTSCSPTSLIVKFSSLLLSFGVFHFGSDEHASLSSLRHLSSLLQVPPHMSFVSSFSELFINCSVPSIYRYCFWTESTL